MTPTRSLFRSIIPVVVGICTMLVLDSQLGNITQEQFLSIFQNRWLRIVTLFGAAYSANGNNAMFALIASVFYIYLLSGTAGAESFDRPPNDDVPPKASAQVFRNMTKKTKAPVPSPANTKYSTVESSPYDCDPFEPKDT